MDATTDVERLLDAAALLRQCAREERDPLLAVLLQESVEAAEDALLEALTACARAAAQYSEDPAQPTAHALEAGGTGDRRRQGVEAGAGGRDRGGHVRLIGG